MNKITLFTIATFSPGLWDVGGKWSQRDRLLLYHEITQSINTAARSLANFIIQ